MSLAPTIGGRLREGTSGVDRSQAGCCVWGIDPVKEIGQTCGLNVIMRRLATSNRSVVTAAKLVYSTWKFTQPGERNGKAIYRHRPTPQQVHVLHPAGERTHVRDRVGTGESGQVREEIAAKRRDRGGDYGQHEVVLRRGGPACGARSGSEHEPVQSDPPVSEENRSARRAGTGAVLVEKHAAGG